MLYPPTHREVRIMTAKCRPRRRLHEVGSPKVFLPLACRSANDCVTVLTLPGVQYEARGWCVCATMVCCTCGEYVCTCVCLCRCMGESDPMLPHDNVTGDVMLGV